MIYTLWLMMQRWKDTIGQDYSKYRLAVTYNDSGSQKYESRHP
jgi:hypothetical protein